jgi:HTH-type transcriptional regulator/antitoxin HigA
VVETLRPARTISPGRIILNELDARGWSQQDLASIMGRPEQMLSEIIHAKKQITAETAHQLAKAFGTTPDFWLNLEMQYQLNQVASQNQDQEIERRSRLYRLAPISEMIKRGWIQASDSINVLEQAYCRFFNVQSIDLQPQMAVRLRASADRGPQERAVIAWVRQAERLALEQTVPDYNRKDFEGLLEKLLRCASKAEDIGKIPGYLLSHGIHFVIVPHLSKTYLDGAAFWIDGNPVVALTLRYDRIDTFWFTLMHELAHIYHDHKIVHVDQLFGREEEDFGREEVIANQQAVEWLMPQPDFKDFIESSGPRFSRTSIEVFSEKIERHPGIVIGQLMHAGIIKYSSMREYLVKVSHMLEGRR